MSSKTLSYAHSRAYFRRYAKCNLGVNQDGCDVCAESSVLALREVKMGLPKALCVVIVIVLATSAAYFSSPQAQPLVVTSITSQGLQPDGRHHVTLHGTFQSPADIGTVALCNGRLTPSTVHSATQSTLDVSIPSQLGSPECVFLAWRLTDGA